jgi:hypothetical protein
VTETQTPAARWELDARPHRSARTSVVVAVVLFLIFTIGGIWLRHGSTGVTFQRSDQIAMIVLGVLLAGSALLFTRPRLRAGRDGVLVRNLFSDKPIPWEMIRGLSFPDGKAWGRIELPADEYIPVLALRTNDKHHTIAAGDHFRTLLAKYGTSA